MVLLHVTSRNSLETILASVVLDDKAAGKLPPEQQHGFQTSECGHVTFQAMQPPALEMHQLPGARLPSTQKAVVTPEMGSELNLHLCTIPVRQAALGEATVRILYSGICRSVSGALAHDLL
jgi:hypothetical protein